MNDEADRSIYFAPSVGLALFVGLSLILILIALATATYAATIAPNPPASYTPPISAVRVGDGDALVRALARTMPQNIVLADGVYSNNRPFLNACGHHLYAEHLGKAVLKTGLSVGSNWCGGGAIIQGLTFDVRDPLKILHGSIIHVWGRAAGTQLLDLTLNGNGLIDAGVKVRQPDGFVLRRMVAQNFLGYGVLVDANVRGLTLDRPPVIEDLDISNVSYRTPMSSGGKAEACLWIGNTALVRRLRVRNCAWTGVWTGTAAKETSLGDVDADGSPYGVGIYLEHFSQGTALRRLKIGPNIRLGVSCEWADPAWGSEPACDGVTIEDSEIDSTCVGVYLDEGTRNTTVRRTKFLNQSWAAIADYKGWHNLYDTADNDTRQIAAGAVTIANDHIGSSRCGF